MLPAMPDYADQFSDVNHLPVVTAVSPAAIAHGPASSSGQTLRTSGHLLHVLPQPCVKKVLSASSSGTVSGFKPGNSCQQAVRTWVQRSSSLLSRLLRRCSPDALAPIPLVLGMTLRVLANDVVLLSRKARWATAPEGTPAD